MQVIRMIVLCTRAVSLFFIPFFAEGSFYLLTVASYTSFKKTGAWPAGFAGF